MRAVRYRDSARRRRMEIVGGEKIAIYLPLYDSSYIAPLYYAVLHALRTHTCVRYNAAAGREGSFLVPGL